MRVFNGLDDFASAVGTVLGTSDWMLISQEMIQGFADITGDDQWIHVDPSRARQGPFGTTIAHGYLTVALIPALTAQVFVIEGVISRINYGSNRVRFPAPVPAGSRLRAVVELLDLKRTSHGATATHQVTLELEGSTRPACIAETVARITC